MMAQALRGVVLRVEAQAEQAQIRGEPRIALHGLEHPRSTAVASGQPLASLQEL